MLYCKRQEDASAVPRAVRGYNPRRWDQNRFLRRAVWFPHCRRSAVALAVGAVSMWNPLRNLQRYWRLTTQLENIIRKLWIVYNSRYIWEVPGLVIFSDVPPLGMVLSLFPVTLLVSLNFAPLETVFRSRPTGLSLAAAVFAATFTTASVVLLRD